MPYTFDDLIALMEMLRSDEGCPWDREQTFESIKTHLLEETYEVMDAVDQEDHERLSDELGDLLYQVIFYAQIAKESEQFTIAEVIDRVYRKLERRHPHVFGPSKANTPDEALASWESRKVAEKGSIPFEFPTALPALLKAYRTIDKAKSLGSYQEAQSTLLSNIEEAIQDLGKAVDGDNENAFEKQLAILLLTLSALAHTFRIDPEQALQKHINNMIRRLREGKNVS